MIRFTKAALACVLAATPTVASAVVQSTGTTPGGAAWRIAVPDDWAPGDGLVLVQHGFAFDTVADPSLGPLAAAMLADGYAVAASGYRQRGWAMFHAKDDNAELLDVFRARHGDPGPLVMAGGSMGGLVSLKLAEDPRFRDDTVGVLAYCPVADGVAAWDTAFDLRLAYDAVCQAADGGDLPRGAEPTPWALDLAQLPATVDTPEDSDALVFAAGAIARCTGLGIPEPLRTSGMRERLARLMAVAETSDEEAFLQHLAYAVVGLSELVRAPDKLAGAVPFFNRDEHRPGQPRDLEYGLGLDPAIRRVPRDSFARLAFHRSSSLDGSAKARIVTLHTQADAVVPLWHQESIAARYAGRPLLQAVAANGTAAHCGFSAAEVEAGWRTLRDWLRPGAATPGIAELQAQCADAGGVPGECRYADDSSARIAAATPRLRTTLSDVLVALPLTKAGLWATPGVPAQGVMIEELDEPVGSTPRGTQRVAVYWYTWAPQDDPAPGPRWIVGVGQIYESMFFADEMMEVRGGVAIRWGRVEMDLFPDPARLRYAGPPEWGIGSRDFRQTTTSDLHLPRDVYLDPTPALDFRRLGTYYSPAHPGQGWVLNQFWTPPRVSSLLVWYTHEPDGRPAWLFGIDGDERDGLQFDMTRAVQGGTFETGVSPRPPFLQPWGRVRLQADACDVVEVAWESDVSGFGDGRLPVTRLTAPFVREGRAACR